MSNFNPIDTSLYRVQAPQNILDDDDDKERKRKKEDFSSLDDDYSQAKKKAASIAKKTSLSPSVDPDQKKEPLLKIAAEPSQVESKEKQKVLEILKENQT
jgi:hypothetical protein